MTIPATTLAAELEAALLEQVQAWIPAYAAAHPGADLSQMLRDLGHVLVAVLLATAEAQANPGRAVPHTLQALMRQVVQPILLRAIHDTAEAVSPRGLR